MKRFLNWEYWPTYLFYIPIIPYAVYLAIKAKNVVFYSATNPAIKHSGNGTESKFDTLKLIPDQYKPKSIFIDVNEDLAASINKFKNTNINFPCIAKPDIGFRGLLVKKIDTLSDLESYLTSNSFNIIVQEFIDYENECGIFYYRIPGEKKGKITSITLKKFLTVKGNGNSTIKELILNDERAKRYISILKENKSISFDSIPNNDKEVILSFIGNHSKGAQFINGNHLIDEELTNMMDDFNRQIEGWFYGRIDLKYISFDELKKGEKFKVIELNGIISEPTHIYDPSKITYFKALLELKKHWNLIYQIAIKNHHFYNIQYDKTIGFIKGLLTLKKYVKNLKN